MDPAEPRMVRNGGTLSSKFASRPMARRSTLEKHLAAPGDMHGKMPLIEHRADTLSWWEYTM